MSGICGAIAFGEGPSQLLAIQPVLDQLQRRGPEGTKVWCSEKVVLGYTLLATTPEATVEALPLGHAESGCVITADARIDNRDELLAVLGVSSAGRIIGDGEIILRSYLKWGDECPAHLLGDFAFAIWDEHRSRLFCARDPMGMRRLAYSELPGRGLVFATDPSAVVRHPLVEARLNELRVADYLEGFEDWNLESTFFENVSRLLPGHVLIADPGGISVWRYWELRPEPELRLGSDDEYSEAFLEVFTEAVRCRLRSDGPVGSMLSGGVDSGSIAAIAASLCNAGDCELRTFSAVGPSTSDSAETRSTYASMEAIPGILPSVISYADLGQHLTELARRMVESDEPFDADMTIIRAVYLLASEAGVKVVLDGVSADMVLCSTTLVGALLRRGQVGRAIREARGKALFFSDPRQVWTALAGGAWHAYAPAPLRGIKRRISGAMQDRALFADGLVQPSFAKSAGFVRRRRALRRQSTTSRILDQQERIAWVSNGTLLAGRERYERVAGEFGIEARDPFVDLRLIRFALSLPGAQLQRDGYSKFILRNAMQSRLPDEVLWRRGREHHGLSFTSVMLSGAPEACASVGRAKETIGKYVNLDKAAKGRDGPMGSEGFADWLTTVYLANWFVYVAGPVLGRPSSKGNHDAGKVD